MAFACGFSRNPVTNVVSLAQELPQGANRLPHGFHTQAIAGDPGRTLGLRIVAPALMNWNHPQTGLFPWTDKEVAS